MQIISPNHEYTIIFVFELAKSARFFSGFHMKIFKNIGLYARLLRVRLLLTNHREYPTYTAFYSVFMTYLKFSQFHEQLMRNVSILNISFDF